MFPGQLSPRVLHLVVLFEVHDCLEDIWRDFHGNIGVCRPSRRGQDIDIEVYGRLPVTLFQHGLV